MKDCLKMSKIEMMLKPKSVWGLDSTSNHIESFLSKKCQRVLLNSQPSEWLPVQADVT